MKKWGTKIKFIFESAIPQKNFYIRNAHSSIRKLAKLFSVPPPFVVVHAFRDRSSFLKAIHKKQAPDWLVAYVPPKSTSRIYVFDNKERFTPKKVLSQVLLHEMTHLYTNVLNPKLPDWLKEGISIYVASQILKPSISATDWKKITQEDVPFSRVSWRLAAEHNGYNIAGLLIMFFVRRYGWGKFIASISCHDTEHFSMKSIPSYCGEEPNELVIEFKKQFVK